MRVHAFASSTILSLALMSNACAAGPMSAPTTCQAEDGPQVTVTRDGEHLNIDYRFGRDVPVWAFQDSALEQDSRFFFPAYLGPFGWLGLDFDAAPVDWTEVVELVDASYRLTAGKRLIKELDARG